MSRTRWTKVEDGLLMKLYSIKTDISSIQKALPKRSLKSVYNRIHTLKLKREKKPLPINIADFSLKTNKRCLENEAVKVVQQTGGWFGIPGPAILEHYNTFSTLLRENSPFIAVEENSMQYNKMSSTIKHKQFKTGKFTLIKGELFDVLSSFSKLNPKVPLFSYGHLDFCKTTSVLVREFNLLTNLTWLSKWNQLKDIFYLDITVSCRPDGERMYKRLFQQTIPLIFEAAGWQVTDPRKLEESFIITYKDGTPMANALYKFSKV